MTQMIKTTVVLPEDQLRAAKIKAINENMTLSAILSRALNIELTVDQKADMGLEPVHRLGVFKLGVKKPYQHRSDIYDAYIKRKMGN